MKRLPLILYVTVLTLVLCAGRQSAESLHPELDIVPGTANDDFFVIAANDYYLPVGSNDQFSVNFPQVVTPPEHGVIQYLGQGGVNFGFPHDQTYTGFDTFTYKICGPINANGDSGCTNVATVTLLLIGSDNSQDLGYCPFPPNAVGKPVNVTTGNMWLNQVDYDLPGVGEAIQVDRVYNSSSQRPGLFGLGWTTKYDESLTINDDRMLRLNLPDAKGVFFGRPTTDVPFRSVAPDLNGTITKELDGTYTLTFQDGRTHKFNTAGRVEWQRDKVGNQTTLNYDQNGQLASVTDPVGRTLTFISNPNGTVAQIADSIGTVADYQYAPGTTHLQTVTYPDGSKYKFEYTTVGGKTYLATVKDALDNVLETHAYDSLGRATTSEKHGGVEKYTLNYSSSGQTIVTDGLGRVTKYNFAKSNGRNLVTQVEGQCGCGSGGAEATQYYYTVNNRLDSIIDALGRLTYFAYDPDGNRIRQTDPLGIQKWTYNARGQVLTYKDRVDQSTVDNTETNTYDPNGNLLTVTNRLGHTTTLTYNAQGKPATVTDARSKTTTFDYDTLGRLTQITDANSKNTTFNYDARARVTSVTNALTETTLIDYDLNNRLKKITFPDTNYIEHTYDLAGRRTATRDPRGNSTTFGYDNAYRLTSITDPLTHATTYGYDLMSNRTSQTDALGNITNFEYDDFDRLKKVTYPPATVGATRLQESTTYDKLGNVKTRVDTAGRTTTYDYDNSNRLWKITDPLTHATEFTYNQRSQMTKVKDALNREYIFTYDPLGRKLSETRAGTTMSHEYDAVGNRIKRTDHNGAVTDYAYDDLNRPTTKTYQGAVDSTFTYDDLSRLLTAANGAGTVSFTYDNRGRVDTTTDVHGRVVDYDYDAKGNRTLLKLNGANFAQYAYDAADRLTSMSDFAASGGTVYAYDNADRLAQRTYQSGTNKQHVITTYAYDGLSRQKQSWSKRSNTTLLKLDYTYDNAHRITQIVESGRTRTYGYDNLDRLTAATDTVAGSESYAYDAVGNRISSHRSASYSHGPFNRLNSSATANYTYDLNGSMLTRADAGGTMTFAYDLEKRLVGANNGSGSTSEYRYDALGRRVSTKAPGQAAAVKHTFDGDDLLLSDNASVLSKFLNGPGIDNKVTAQLNGGVRTFYLGDHLGTTMGTTGPTGAFTAAPRGDSFGNGANDFTGRERDAFTGLHYYRARWYDANLGRFTSEDPIGFEAGDINLYAYVRNNPVRFNDPFGLDDADRIFYESLPPGWDRPQPSPAEVERRERIAACYRKYKFSSVFSFGDPDVETALEYAEIGSVSSLALDGAATGRKYLGPRTASSNHYASGINMVSKDINRAMGFPRIAGSPLGKYLTPIGTKLSPPLALFGAGTLAYNITTDIQCSCGVID